MSHRLILTASLALLAGCAGVELRPSAVPSPDVLQKELKFEEEFLYSADDTYKNTPEMWLGRVGVVRRNGKDCGMAVRLQWEGTPLQNPTASQGEDPNLGYPVAAKVTDPEIQAQTLVTRKVAGDISALSVVSAQLDEDSAAEIILTAFATQRIQPSPRYKVAYDAYVAAHEKEWMKEDSDVCYAFVVTGYSHKILITKKHQKVTANSKGGYSGVNVSGAYMANTEGYRLSHLFMLSPTMLRDLRGVPKGRSTLLFDKEDLKRIQEAMLQEARK